MGACPEPRLLGPKRDGYTTGERIAKLLVPGPGGHFVPLGWPRRDSDWPENGKPDYIEIGTAGSPKVGGYFHVQNGGNSGEFRPSSAPLSRRSTGSSSPRSASRASPTAGT